MSLPIFIQVALNEISGPGQNFCEHKLRVMSFSVHSRQGIGNELGKLSQKALSWIVAIFPGESCVRARVGERSSLFLSNMLSRAITRSVTNQK